MSCDQFFSKYRVEDYFVITGPRGGDLCRDVVPGDAVHFFTVLMDDFAERKEAQWWLEKTPKHTIYFEELVRRFPNAQFVVITRDVRDTLASQLRMYPRTGAKRLVQVAEKAYRYASDMKALDQLRVIAPARTFAVTYEALRENTDGEIARLLVELGLPAAHLKSEFAPSSSFTSAGDRTTGRLTAFDWAIATICMGAVRRVPFGVLVRLRERRDRSQATGLPKYSRLGDTYDDGCRAVDSVRER
jgi:hypothetical protein